MQNTEISLYFNRLGFRCGVLLRGIYITESTFALLGLVKDPQPEIKEYGYGGFSDALMYRYEDGIRYHKRVADTIYTIDTSMLVSPEFVFDYGRYKRPIDEKKLAGPNDVPNYVTLYTLAESKRFLFMQFIFGALSREPYKETRTIHGVTKTVTLHNVMVLYNKTSGKVNLLKQPQKGDLGFQNDFEEGSPSFWPTFMSRDGTEMVMLYEAEEFIDKYSKVKNPSEKLKKVLQSVKFDSNPVAIIAKLK